MHYLFETSGCKAVNSQHNCRGADEPSRHEHYVVVEFRDGAYAESNDTNTCDQNKRNERLMGDALQGLLRTYR